jgi:hypothetical protein
VDFQGSFEFLSRIGVEDLKELETDKVVLFNNTVESREALYLAFEILNDGLLPLSICGQ